MRPRTKQRPMTPMLALGLRVQAIRQQRDWTQEKLAERCGVSLGYLARVETGYHNPRMTTLVKLATGLKVKPGRLRLGYQVVLSHPKLTKAIASARLKSDTVDASFVRLKVIQT
jgi:transcriptional regulator with XRE-family HTH domain